MTEIDEFNGWICVIHRILINSIDGLRKGDDIESNEEELYGLIII